MTETATALIYRVAILFCMMVPGFILKKCKLVGDGFGKGVSAFVLYAAQPTLVFLAYLQPYDPSLLRGLFWVFLYSILAHIVFICGALLFFRRKEAGKQKILRLATILSNAAFMGIPLIGMLLGEQALLYATVYNITFNLVLWSFGVFICTHDRDHNEDGTQSPEEKHEVRKTAARSILRAVVHPVTIAALLGLVCFLFSLGEYIPALLTDSFDMLSATVAPLSMLVIGLRLATTDFGSLLRDGATYLFLALRHLVLPIAVLLLLWGSGRPTCLPTG